MHTPHDEQAGKALEFFREVNLELANLKSIRNLLAWDQETVMPPAGGRFRAGQSATVAALSHQKLTDPRYGAILEQLEEADELDERERINVREARRDYDRATRVPESLVRELAETTSMAYDCWVEARNDSDLESFLPWLEKVIHLARQKAACLCETDNPYDALLEEYEPGLTVAELDPLLGALRPGLSLLTEEILTSPYQPDESLLKGEFPQVEQMELGRAVVSAMGYQWEAGRLDLSPHPFCTGLTPHDVRITTRYSEEDLSVGLFGIIHEAGHGLYEQGLDAHRFGEPTCETISLGIHESQSRLWEIYVARGRPFWQYWYGRLRRAFPGSFSATPLEEFLRAINQVRPSLIRVDADEVTYGLHVIMRYEIEKSFFDGGLEAKDVEEVWNQKMKEYLNLTPPDAARGVLQDVHWSLGLLGYFPTYLLGTVYANQLYEQARREIPDLEGSIARGEMLELLGWLRDKVHRPGRTWNASQLVERITGRPPDPDAFLRHLQEKYGELYRLD